MNGMARGTVPADHELAFSRARSKALKEADVALVIGVPMDFRLGFGGVFGEQTRLVVADRVDAGAAASPRGCGGALRRPDDDPFRACRAAVHRPRGVDRRPAGSRVRRSRRRAGRTDRRPQPAAPDAGVRRAETAAGPRRHRCNRRRRLRLLRRTSHRQLCTGRVAGQRTVRLSGLGSRLRAGRQAGPARPAGGACCRATARSGSAAWSGIRWCATVCTWFR